MANERVDLKIGETPEHLALIWTIYLDLVKVGYFHARALIDSPETLPPSKADSYKLAALHQLVMDPEHQLDLNQFERELKARYGDSFNEDEFVRAIVSIGSDLNRNPAGKVTKTASGF